MSASTSTASFVDNYKFGCFLGNHCNVGVELLDNVVPFTIEHLGDEKLAKPSLNKKACLRISKFCKLFRKTGNGTKVYDLKKDNYNKLVYQLALDNAHHASHHITFHAKDDAINNYIVKVVPVNTWKDANTAMKELHMAHDIYVSTYLTCKGSDITCKPFFGCLFWSGKKWKYLSIWEKAKGIPLSDVFKQKYLNRDYNKDKIITSVANAVQTMWILGFAHNDLYDANVLYDFKTNKTTIIDFEMAVKLPHYHVQDWASTLYIRKSKTVKMSWDYCEQLAGLFKTNAKEMAISILALSKGVCYVNADEDGFIYNTDEYFLPMLYERL